MSYQEEFNAATNVTYLKQDDACISVRTGHYGPYVYHTYNFITRTMTITTGNNDGGITFMPFSQLDREVLEAMREKLITLGGKPPSLPAAHATRDLIQKGTTP